MKTRVKLYRPPCVKCKKPMNAKWARKKLQRDVLMGWGHNAGNLFCSQRCGYLFAFDVVFDVGVVHTETKPRVDLASQTKTSRDNAVRDYNRKKQNPGAWMTEKIDPKRYPVAGGE